MITRAHPRATERRRLTVHAHTLTRCASLAARARTSGRARMRAQPSDLSDLSAPRVPLTPVVPLVGYEGATKTKFSERPVFVEGGGRIVNEEAVSSHDAKLLGARNRRQKRLAESRGSSGASVGGPPPPNFERVQNFGSGGVVGFLVQSGATGGATGGGSSSAATAPPAAGGTAGDGASVDGTSVDVS